MRILLDTNVVLSALLWRGTPYRLLNEIWHRPDAKLFTSPPLIGELADVLGRPIAAKRLVLIGLSARQVLLDYTEVTEVVAPPTVTPRVVPDDRDDDHVIAAAVAAQADMIVSGDRHLLALATHERIPIRSPAEALKFIQVGKLC